MSLTANSSLKSGEKKIFHELDVHHVQKVGIKGFLVRKAKMSLTANSSLKSVRRKYFHELDVHHVQEEGIKRFWAQEAKMSLTANSSLKSARRIFFMNSTYIMSRKQESNVLGSGGENESKSQQLCRIGESKIFDELDVHHVQKVGIKRFWAVEAELSLTATSSLLSARRKFLMNSTYIMSRKQESNVFGSGGKNQFNSQQLCRIGESKIFDELDVHHVQKVGIKRFWAQQAAMSLTANSSLKSARRKFFMKSTYIMSRKQESKVFWFTRPK